LLFPQASHIATFSVPSQSEYSDTLTLEVFWFNEPFSNFVCRAKRLCGYVSDPSRRLQKIRVSVGSALCLKLD